MWHSSIWFSFKPLCLPCVKHRKPSLSPWSLCFTSAQLLQDTMWCCPRVLTTQGFKRGARAALRGALTSWNCVRNWPCALFRERVWILYQISSGPCDQKREESLTGALLASFISFPPLALLCLSDSLKFPPSHRRLPRIFHRLPSLHYWPSWMSRFTPPLLGLPSYFADIAFLKMICAYSFSPFTLSSLGLRGHSPWPCNISPWPSEFLPSPGPFLLPSLLFRFVLLSSAAKWRFSTIFCRQAHCLSVFFSLATSPRPMYVRLPHLLELRSVFISAVSTGMPDNTCTISVRKFILLPGSSSFFFFFKF